MNIKEAEVFKFLETFDFSRLPNLDLTERSCGLNDEEYVIFSVITEYDIYGLKNVTFTFYDYSSIKFNKDYVQTYHPTKDELGNPDFIYENVTREDINENVKKLFLNHSYNTSPPLNYSVRKYKTYFHSYLGHGRYNPFTYVENLELIGEYKLGAMHNSDNDTYEAFDLCGNESENEYDSIDAMVYDAHNILKSFK